MSRNGRYIAVIFAITYEYVHLNEVYRISDPSGTSRKAPFTPEESLYKAQVRLNTIAMTNSTGCVVWID